MQIIESKLNRTDKSKIKSLISRGLKQTTHFNRTDEIKKIFDNIYLLITNDVKMGHYYFGKENVFNLHEIIFKPQKTITEFRIYKKRYVPNEYINIDNIVYTVREITKDYILLNNKRGMHASHFIKLKKE